MAEVESAPAVEEVPAAEENAEPAEEPITPPACPALAALYGKNSFPVKQVAPSLPFSSVIAACWPEQLAEVRPPTCAQLCAPWQLRAAKATLSERREP